MIPNQRALTRADIPAEHWCLQHSHSKPCFTCDLAALERDLDRSALEIEAARELVVQAWKLAHRIAGHRAAIKQEIERRED